MTSSAKLGEPIASINAMAVTYFAEVIMVHLLVTQTCEGGECSGYGYSDKTPRELMRYLSSYRNSDGTGWGWTMAPATRLYRHFWLAGNEIARGLA
jgi:hypothetical protein